jgi:peroxiredoxin
LPATTHLTKIINPLIVISMFLSMQAAHATKAPKFSLQGDSNKTISLASYRGKVVYVDFWASWCTPCKQSFPWMNEIQQRYRHRGLEIIAINLDSEKSDADNFLKKVRTDFTIAYDPSGKIAEKYHVQVMPSSYLISKNGDVVHLHRGFKAGDRQNMERKITEALKLR